MKKLVLFITVALAATTAFAQNDGDRFFLNHLSVGVSAGTDGIAADVAMPLSRNFSVRGGYAFGIPNVYSYTDNPKMKEPWVINQDITGVASLSTNNAHLLFDIFPSKKGGFHFTVGAYAMFKPGVIHIQTADPLPIPQREYLYTGVQFGPNDDKYLTTDAEGYVMLDIRTGASPIKPYVGIGFGRPVADSRVSFFVDLGAICGGSLEPIVYDYGIRGKQDDPVVTVVTSVDTEGYDKGIIDKVAAIPLWPVLKFNLFVKLF